MSLVAPFEEIFADKTDLLATHESWERVELGEVCQIVNGFPFPSKFFNRDKGFPIVRIRDLQRDECQTRYAGEVPKEVLVDSADLLIGMDGIFRCVEWQGGKAGLNQRVCKIIPNERFLDRKFLLFGINGYLRAIQDATSSVTVGHLSSRDILRIPFPLPPVNEQRRIVAKLERLLGKVNACQQRLAKIPLLLERFRQSVLAAACSGRLTADWREENLVSPVSVPRSEDAELPKIPESWRWVKLLATGEMSRGRSRHRPRDEPTLYGGLYPFIQTGDIAQSGGRITSHKQTYSEAGLAQSRLWDAGTICITIAANIAESAILTYPACFPDSVVGIIVNPKIAKAEYVEFFVRVAKANLATFAPATAQKNINVAILNEVLVPLPPLAEQQEIVRRVEALFALADQIEARFTQARAQTDKLTPSLLARAFRGELVLQDSNNEPASMLLERIKAQKPAQKAASKSRSDTVHRYLRHDQR